MDSKIQKMEKAHQESIKSSENLQKIIKEKQSVIDKLSQKSEPTPAARQSDPKPAPQPIKTH